MPSQPFTHLGQSWTLFQRSPSPEAPWYFAPRWGERKQKLFHCLKDKATGTALSLPKAILAAQQLITAHFQGPDQYEALREQTRLLDAFTVGKLLELYQAAGCPDRQGNDRTAGPLATEQINCRNLLVWWHGKLAALSDNTMRDAYRQHRKATARTGDGARSTELELGTLNNALHWAWRKKLLRELPREMKTSYRDPDAVAHRRFQMPDCGNELHALASWCFAQAGAAPQQRWGVRLPPSPSPLNGERAGVRGETTHDSAPRRNLRPAGQWECFGWTILLLAHTGLRIGEAAQLLASPQRAGDAYPPGFIDDKYLRIRREKNGCNPKIQLDDPSRPHIRPLLQSIKQWHASRYPDAKLLLPGERPDMPFNNRGFGRALDAACAALHLAKRVPHGLRAYYTSVRLAQGTKPDMVAIELGQRSGEELVRDVYGVEPDDHDETHWTSLAHRYTWLPNTAENLPAWHWWTERRTSNVIAL